MSEGLRIEGKHLILFEKGVKGAPDYGSLSDIRVGDSVLLYQGAYKYYTIGSISGSKWNKKLKTKQVTYNGLPIGKAFYIEYSEIIKLLRPLETTTEPNKQAMLPI